MYGHWSSTPTLPFTSWLPARNVVASVHCYVVQKDSLFQYSYSATNKNENRRRIERVSVKTDAEAKSHTFDSWQGLGANDRLPGLTWKMIGTDRRKFIHPGETLSMFRATSRLMPGINKYFIQSERGLMEVDYTLADLWHDIETNSTSGLTLAPAPPLFSDQTLRLSRYAHWLYCSVAFSQLDLESSDGG
jgi:hypothetical protein